MVGAKVGHRDDLGAVREIGEIFGALHPGYRLGYGRVDGAARQIVPDGDGARILWLDTGTCEAWLAGGHRTNEGDGASLPVEYTADALTGADHEALRTLRAALGRAHPDAAVPLRAMADRYTGEGYRGAIAGEVWKLLESGLPQDAWIADAAGGEAIAHILARGRDLGWSTKGGPGSFEQFTAGDQLIVTAEAPLQARGRFGYWWMELPAGPRPPGSASRRLRYLKDTAGGCAPGFDAFRRLTLPWEAYTGTRERPDGVNVVNSHAVQITAAQSRTHYHPVPPIGGGIAQSEFYLVIDGAELGVQRPDVPSVLHISPDISDWSLVEHVALRPGSIVLIPPGTGHRGIDALVNVVTVPGFKPGNEIYVDAAIAARTKETGMFNRAFATQPVQPDRSEAQTAAVSL
jgi:hypothetical protein